MIIISERALFWCRSWDEVGGSISSNAKGQLVLRAQPTPDQKASTDALLAAVKHTPGLADEIAQVFIIMSQPEKLEKVTLQ